MARTKRKDESQAPRAFFLYVNGAKKARFIIHQVAMVEAAHLAASGVTGVRVDVYEGNEYRESWRY